jgi:Flp pilus assembly protein CpaB
MKNRMALSIAVVFSVVLLSMTAMAQGGLKPVADTGMITLGVNQVLRITVAAGDLNGDDNIRIRFRRMGYIEQDNIYRVASTNTSATIALTSGEATSIDISNLGSGVRGVVLSNNPKVKVLGIVFDTSTQRVVSICTFIPD